MINERLGSSGNSRIPAPNPRHPYPLVSLLLLDHQRSKTCRRRRWEMSDLVDRQMRYWSEFGTHVRRNSNRMAGLPSPHPSTANELLVSIGGGDGVELRMWMNTREQLIAVCFYLTGSEKDARYDALLSMQTEIDAAFRGDNLEWRQPSSRAAGYIALIKQNVDPLDESDRETQFVWLQQKLERFDAVFRPIVKRI